MSIKSPLAWAAYKQARLRILMDFLKTVESADGDPRVVAEVQQVYDDAHREAWRIYLQEVARSAS